MPRSHAWTTPQKWLITFGGALAIMVVATIVYRYERYHRGPSESAFFGTWKSDFVDSDHPTFLRLGSDQNFDMSLSQSFDDSEVFLRGRWYAGGPNLYIRFNADALRYPSRPMIWKIEDVSKDRFTLRIAGRQAETFDRVK